MSEYLFEGLKVVDAATVIAGPAAAMMLADFGAEVVKIERPGVGDMLRRLSSIPIKDPAAQNYMWQMDGRNKKSIALNLKSDAGLKVLHDLAAWCDVFITNMPYPSRERYGLTYEDLKPANPSMIYSSLTAYGELGDERNRKAFDQLAYWARSGLMDLMRAPDTRPTQGLPGMGDHPTAVSIFASIVLALLKRERTGKGSFAQTSLFANGLWSNAAIAQGVLAGGDMSPMRDRRDEPVYTMRLYRTQDDRWLQFNMVRHEEHLTLLFLALDALDLLVDERFETPMKMYENRGELGQTIQSIIAQKTANEWMSMFKEAGVPVNLIALVEETVGDTQLLENRMATVPSSKDVGVPLVINHPIQVSDVDHKPVTRAPELGEHSREVLTMLGYEESVVNRLFDEGAVDEP